VLLKRVLDALAALRVPDGATVECLVCDNNSTDQTKTIVEGAAGDFAIGPLRYLFEPQQGKSHALNRAVAGAEGDWLLFIDDDIRVPPHWLEAYVEAMGRYPDAACLGGGLETWMGGRPTRRQTFLMTHYPAAFGLLDVAEDTRLNPPEVTAFGGNMAVRADAMPDGGFDPNAGMFAGARIAGEDVGLLARVIGNGGEGWLIAGAAVGHFIPHDRAGAKQLWRWNMGIGRRWVAERGLPEKGRFGVAWWAWREYARRLVIAASRWRPTPSRDYYRAYCDAAQYYGYLTADSSP